MNLIMLVDTIFLRLKEDINSFLAATAVLLSILVMNTNQMMACLPIQTFFNALLMISFLKLVFIFLKKSKEKLSDFVWYFVTESSIFLYISLIDRVRLTEEVEFMGSLLRWMVENIEIHGELVPGILLVIYLRTKIVDKLQNTDLLQHFKKVFYANYGLSFFYSMLRYIGLVSNDLRIMYPWPVLFLMIISGLLTAYSWIQSKSLMNKQDLVRCITLTLVPPVILIAKDCP